MKENITFNWPYYVPHAVLGTFLTLSEQPNKIPVIIPVLQMKKLRL